MHKTRNTFLHLFNKKYFTNKLTNRHIYVKIDIMKISQDIGTYETSILPYEDCCSVFLPDSPVTKPKMQKIIENEKVLDVEGLISDAIANIELIKIN